MTTREQIISAADALIREKGYNAFSFFDISNQVGIRKPSIHYHFPQKTDLGLAVIDYHQDMLEKIKDECSTKSAVQKLDRFLSIYHKIKYDGKICIAGSLATDYHTLDNKLLDRLKVFSNAMLEWVTSFLAEGQSDGTLHFTESPRTKAILIISNMVAIVQLSRLTDDADFELIQTTIKQELTQNSQI